MKKFALFIISLFILLVSNNALASDFGDYSIVVDEDYNLSVFLSGNTSGTPLSDYPDFFSFENGVLTLNEGARVVYILSDADITITSNNKPVRLHNVNKKNRECDPIFKIDKLNNQYEYSTGSGFVIIGGILSVEITDSYLKSGLFQTEDRTPRADGKERIIIKNSTIDDGVIRSWYGIYITDSIIHADEVFVYHNNINIINSKVTVKSQIHSNAWSDLETNIINSELYCDSESCLLDNGNGPDPNGVLLIKDSIIKNYNLMNQKNTVGDGSYLKIINSSFENLKWIYTYCPIYIIDSNISLDSISNTSSDTNNPNNGVFVWNSSLTVNDLQAMGIIDVDNSYVISKNLLFQTYPINTNMNIKDSYVRLINDSSQVFNNTNHMTVHNSNFYAETSYDRLYFTSRTSSNYEGATIEIDDDLDLIDKDDNKLHLFGAGIFDPTLNLYQYYQLMYDGDEDETKSLKLISQAKVTFKVENGTWSDGSNKNIEITKDVWTKLSSDEIPAGMVGDTEGSWEIEPNTEDYIKGNITYVYKFKKKGIVKGVIEELTENPKTGVFRYSFITLLLLCVSILVYRRLTINRYFKYKK